MIDPDTLGERGVPDSLPEWDYQTDLKLRRRLSIDAAACRSAVGLDTDTPLAVSVRWSVIPSLLRGAAAWVPLMDNVQEYVIDVEIAGERLGGVVRVETILVLAGEGPERPAVARLVGSDLWNDTIEIRLQGDAPLFPMALVPFSASGLPHKAAWFLEIGDDLHATAMGAIQLLINQEHAPIVAALGRVSTPTDLDRVILSAMRSDITRTMLERALENDAFNMSEKFGKETLGAVLQGLMRTYMACHVDDDLLDIRRIRANDAPLFAATVQAATDFLAIDR
ncbi:hypothetical protein [Actinoplanes subglobosus]|uniref:Uncharacterized protein n=1 Tax=Actinoplanes subglobosus TaxID=1547892 RepID=A0ABV8ISS6_9ACTN